MEIDIKNKALLRNVKLRMVVENKTSIEEVSELSLMNKTFIKEDAKLNLEEIYKLKNLKKLSIKFFTINDEIIKVLNKLEKLEILEIYMCKFETTERLNGNNIKNIYIYNAENLNLDILDTNKVKAIRIENSGLVDFYKFVKFEKIEKLEVIRCPVISIPKLNLLKSIKELYLQEIDLQFDLEINALEKLEFISLNGSNVNDREEYIQKIKNQNNYIKVEFKNDNRPIE